VRNGPENIERMAPEKIATHYIVRQLLNGAYALVPDIFEVIEAFFKFTAALLLRRLSECL
jgi:hypothetical protein